MSGFSARQSSSVLVGVQRLLDVDRRQQAEDVGLQEDDQHLEQREGQCGDQGAACQQRPAVQLPEEEVRGTEQQDQHDGAEPGAGSG